MLIVDLSLYFKAKKLLSVFPLFMTNMLSFLRTRLPTISCLYVSYITSNAFILYTQKVKFNPITWLRRVRPENVIMENLTRSRGYGVFDQTKLFTCNILYPHNLKIVLANGFLYIQMYVKISTFLYLVTRSPFDVFVRIIGNWIISSCYLVPIRCHIKGGINVDDNTINVDTKYIVNYTRQ